MDFITQPINPEIMPDSGKMEYDILVLHFPIYDLLKILAIWEIRKLAIKRRK